MNSKRRKKIEDIISNLESIKQILSLSNQSCQRLGIIWIQPRMMLI